MASLMTDRERKLEIFETPPHYVAALFNEVSIFGYVYEPCVGDGAIWKPLLTLPSVRRVYTNDIDEETEAGGHFDATQPAAWKAFKTHSLDWTITNPPFSLETEILSKALDHSRNVAFLARLSFLEPTEEREHLLASNPPSQVIVLPRYSFRLNEQGKKQTDNVTCCWLVWFEDRQPRPMKFYSRGAAQAVAVMRGLAE